MNENDCAAKGDNENVNNYSRSSVICLRWVVSVRLYAQELNNSSVVAGQILVQIHMVICLGLFYRSNKSDHI